MSAPFSYRTLAKVRVDAASKSRGGSGEEGTDTMQRDEAQGLGVRRLNYDGTWNGSSIAFVIATTPAQATCSSSSDRIFVRQTSALGHRPLKTAIPVRVMVRN